jgi:hypothetical protein
MPDGRATMRDHDGSLMNRVDAPRDTGIEPIDERAAGPCWNREERTVPNQP